MLFDLEKRVWSAVIQRGWRPEARWSSAIAFSEQSQQLFIFGGTGANGSCRNDVFCCELNSNRASFKYNELMNHIKDIDAVSKRMRSQKPEDKQGANKE